jgi:NAD(P)H-flavin reductase
LLRKVPVVEAAEGRLPVYTLTFTNPAGMEAAPPGFGLRIDYGDTIKVCVPGYKPKSYSMSACRAGEFDITFKVYPGGRASGYLDSLAVGSSMDCFVAGNKERSAGAFVGLVAFGVGITKAMPLAAAELAKPDVTSVQLLWCSKTRGDTFWLAQAAELAAVHPGRFELVETFTREGVAGARRGRVNLTMLAEVFDGAWGTGAGCANEGRRAEVRFLSVGTKAMMHDLDAMLGEIGYDMPGHALLQTPGQGL